MCEAGVDRATGGRPAGAKVATPPHPVTGPPDDDAAFGRFVTSMLRRHAGRIQAVEVWNEPNLDREWKDGINGARYAALLKAAYVAAKAVSPGVLVISAGIGPTPAGSIWTHIDDRVWLRDALARGLADHADCIGAHANGPPGDGDLAPVIARYRALAARPVCVTEFGQALPIGGRTPAGFGWAMGHTEESQASVVVEGLRHAAATRAVRVVILWNLGFGGGEDDSNRHYALREPAIRAVERWVRGG